MRFAPNRNVGTFYPTAPIITMDLATDTAMRAVFGDRSRLRNMCGIIASPSDDLRKAFQACEDGDTIVLLPGLYDAITTIEITKRISVLGMGAVVRGNGVLLDIQADDAQVHGVGFERIDRAAVLTSSAAVLVSGDGVAVYDCTFSTPSQRGLQINGSYCSAQGNKFLPNAARQAGDSDVYFADGAIWGTATGNIWSRTPGAFVIDYRWVDNITESANGNAGIVNIR